MFLFWSFSLLFQASVLGNLIFEGVYYSCVFVILKEGEYFYKNNKLDELDLTTIAQISYDEKS